MELGSAIKAPVHASVPHDRVECAREALGAVFIGNHGGKAVEIAVVGLIDEAQQPSLNLSQVRLCRSLGADDVGLLEVRNRP